MQRRIKMNSISAGPDGAFHMGEIYVEGVTISTEKLDDFLDCGAAYEVAAIANPKPEKQVSEKAVSGPSEVAGKGKVKGGSEKPPVDDSGSPDKDKKPAGW